MRVLGYALGRFFHMFMGLVFCSATVVVLVAWTRPPASVEEPPMYPGVSMGDRSVIPSRHGPGINVLRYAADAKPDAVLAFYKDALPKDGWEPSTKEPSGNGLTFHWSSPIIFHSDNPFATNSYVLSVLCSKVPGLSKGIWVEVRVRSVER